MAVYRRNFKFKLMVVDDHIGRSRWKTNAGVPILALPALPLEIGAMRIGLLCCLRFDLSDARD